MSKAVMLSIRPKGCEKIASGEKTIEVRKTRPKLDTPFKCYIYCTQASVKYQTICGCHVLNSNELYRHPEQGIKHGDSIELMLCENYTKDNFLNGKVIGEFTCDRIFPINVFDNGSIQNWLFEHMKRSCLTYEELAGYIGNGKTGHGWHISDLVIYDTPHDLGEFSPVCIYKADDGTCPTRRVACSFQRYDYNHDGSINLVECGRPLEHPPQSWCYVEAM